MSYGYAGRILRVDLSARRIWVEEPDEVFYRTYMGGANVIEYYLLKELQPAIDPLDPANLLVFATGVLTGAPFSGAGRHSVGAKSPLTGAVAKSESGGYWGAELKFAGWDGIVIQGASAGPVYLHIVDGQASIRDASHVWGREVYETEEAIKDEVGDRRTRVASIGPGGENQVSYACIVNDRRSVAGRSGLGAVMGSKQLKAIAVRGHGRVELADPEQVKGMGREMARAVPQLSAVFHTWGTGYGLPAFNETGNLPVRNWRDGWLDGAEQISAEALKETCGTGMEGCYACAVRCKKIVELGPPWDVRPEYGGPEYETLAGFGANCGISNLEAICLAHQICNANSLDTISASGTVAFAMECFENGLLTLADTGGIELRFGNSQAMIDVLRLIVAREGIGDLLARGSRAAAEQIGGGAEQYAMQVKGLEFGYHEPRLKPALGIGFALSVTGADHQIALHDTFFEKPGRQLGYMQSFGFHDTMPAREISPNKARLFYHLYLHRMAADCLPWCHLVSWAPVDVQDLVRHVTGWNSTWYEIAKVGERAIAMGRVFNAREGLTVAADKLPDRFFEPTTLGVHHDGGLNRQAWIAARDAAYGVFGWDAATGCPTPGKLLELGLDWVIPHIPKVGAVPRHSA